MGRWTTHSSGLRNSWESRADSQSSKDTNSTTAELPLPKQSRLSNTAPRPLTTDDIPAIVAAMREPSSNVSALQSTSYSYNNHYFCSSIHYHRYSGVRRSDRSRLLLLQLRPLVWLLQKHPYHHPGWLGASEMAVSYKIYALLTHLVWKCLLIH